MLTTCSAPSCDCRVAVVIKQLSLVMFKPWTQASMKALTRSLSRGGPLDNGRWCICWRQLMVAQSEMVHRNNIDCRTSLCINISIFKLSTFALGHSNHEFLFYSSSLCVCVCVCGPGTPHVMGTKCPRKDGNLQNPCPCGDIFWPPWGNKLINHTELSYYYYYYFYLKMQKVSCKW